MSEPHDIEMAISCAGQCGVRELMVVKLSAENIVSDIVPPPKWSAGTFAPLCPTCSLKEKLRSVGIEAVRLRALVVRAINCLDANSDKAARREWAEQLRKELG